MVRRIGLIWVYILFAFAGFNQNKSINHGEPGLNADLNPNISASGGLIPGIYLQDESDQIIHGETINPLPLLSNLPIVVIETKDNAVILDHPKVPAHMGIIFNG